MLSVAALPIASTGVPSTLRLQTIRSTDGAWEFSFNVKKDSATPLEPAIRIRTLAGLCLTLAREDVVWLRLCCLGMGDIQRVLVLDDACALVVLLIL